MKRVGAWILCAATALLSSPAVAQAGSSTAARILHGLPIVFEPDPQSTPETPAVLARTTEMTLQMRIGKLRVLPASPGAVPFEIDFANSKPAAPQAIDQLDSKTNYLLGSDVTRWRTHVANYAKVAYRNLYPGVDAVFYGNGLHLEHDFVIAPNSDYRQIRLRFPRNSRLALGRDGHLKVTLGKSIFTMQSPTVYQDGAGGREIRKGSFRRLPGNEVGFRVSRYDRSRPLVIDPVLTFETYLSGYAVAGNAIATDSSGDTFVAGTAAYLYPSTPGSFNGCGTCSYAGVVTFVSKLTPDGTKLIYSTLLGGNDFAQPTGIAVDTAGDAIACGWTAATDFPTKSGQPVLNQYHNTVGFLTSLSPDGSSLNYSTLIGQKPDSASVQFTYAMAVALDSSDNAYVTGQTATGFSVTPGALDNEIQIGSNYDEFLVYVQKFTPGGALTYSAVVGTADIPPGFGGGGPIGASAIAVDSSGAAYITGQASSLWTTTSGAYHNQLPSGDTYAAPFVAKLSADGSTLLYSTYLDYIYEMAGIAVVPNGNVFVTGGTASATYPTTPDAFQPMEPGDSVLTEIDSTGSSLVYSTGLSAGIDGMSIAPDGDIWLVGAANGIPLLNPLQTYVDVEFGSPFVAQFDPHGQTLKFATYLGGTTTGFAGAIAVDPNNHAHITGTVDQGLYTTPGALLSKLPDSLQWEHLIAFVAKVDPTIPAPVLCANPSILSFQNFGSGVEAGVPSSQTVTLSNCGALPLTISNFTSTSSLFSVPQNTCTAELQVNDTCTATIQYLPLTTRIDTGAIYIDYNTSMPAFVSVWGEGAAVSGTFPKLFPTKLDFGGQLLGTQSAALTTMLINAGTLPFNFSSATISGPQMSSFAVSAGCPATLNPGDSCNLTVVFSPKANGAATASLNIADSAGTQTVPLSGSAPTVPFSIAAQSGGSISATVAAGQTAKYLLSVIPAGGYSGTVSLSCSGLPAHAGCSFSPSTLSIADALPGNFTLSMATGSATAASTNLGILFGLTVVFFPLVLRRRRVYVSLLVLLVAAAAGITGCGGGNSGNSTPPPSNAVAPGTYTVQVVATDGVANTTQTLTLVVH